MKLELRNLWHVYSPGTDFEVPALRGASLTVGEKEVLGIVGGTGSGKSTLIQHMNALLTPTSGTVLVDGVDASGMKKSELRRRVGLVFQFPEQGLFAPTVEEDVAFAPRQLGIEEDVAERVRETLELLGIPHLTGRSPHTLSGGEKRRVAVAGVLAMRPEVLVMDEPTAGLDPASRLELLDLVRKQQESGVSVVLVSHDLDEVAEVSGRVCVMEGGEIKTVGPPAEVFYQNLAVAPATVRVAAAVKAGWPALGSPLGSPTTYADTLEALRNVVEKTS